MFADIRVAPTTTTGGGPTAPCAARASAPDSDPTSGGADWFRGGERRHPSTWQGVAKTY
ncbi:hypothetical protein Adu01nite_21410 [Paractinoplanes durhamensis]|uniref:Uncharacterized protein n=1 Tax=Paractinoplanes durhamensis TaxID=113563 RepID=A0ABQ3YT84_9ACTN|nr:hypothetical protein Adu01nite_21410 [Actinoplanes durhamensis]